MAIATTSETGQRLFHLSEEQMEAFQDALDNPPPPNETLKALMARKPLWERYL